MWRINIRRNRAKHLRRGDAVTVRSLDEIFATLDADAKLDGMPFMPEMAPFCGMTFLVRRRAEKTCVEGVGIRSLRNTVFLDGMRCNGSAHGGCQRGCMFFWKEGWLNPAGSEPLKKGRISEVEGGNDESKCCCCTANLDSPVSKQPDYPVSSLSELLELPTVRDDRFYCQSTELAQATSDYSLGKWHCYLHDLRVGEISLRRFGYVLWLALKNRIWRLLHGRGYYQLSGEQKKTIAAELNLQPGEWVEVKSAAEIEATLDEKGRNRGLSFEPEMALHCGRRYRVAAPLQKIILEENGKMVQLDNTVILEGLVCQGLCAKNCPRANYFYWREIWLKRV